MNPTSAMQAQNAEEGPAFIPDTMGAGPRPVEFGYLEQLIRYRLNRYFFKPEDDHLPPVPELSRWDLPLCRFIAANKLSAFEATLLLIALAPHVQPDLFDSTIESKLTDPANFPRIGGVRGKNFRGFIPTGETAQFLLAGDDWLEGLEVQQLFWPDHIFGSKKILWLEDLPPGDPAMSGRINMSRDYIETFIYGRPVPPHFSMSFPAKRVTTSLSWNDLVINQELRGQVEELITWVKHNDELMNDWGMGSRLRKGYRALFYGPPGTGKTFTAGLLGKTVGKDVYKIDLSMVVSKYVGETEKNLELLFARAEDKGWILFFDEADALFGKRTDVRDAHDKYANQEVSYLLQRIEDYNGLIVLATNMKNNIDDAFLRRFNSILKFSLPDPAERAAIWANAFPRNALFRKKPPEFVTSPDGPGEPGGEEANIPEIVKKYEMTGGSIMNAIHYSSLKGLERRVASQSDPGSKLIIYLSDVLEGIRKETMKEGKPFIL